MRFLIGLGLGLLIGVVLAVIGAPGRGEETRRRLQVAFVGEGQGAEETAAEAAEPIARLRRAVQALRDQVREAWQEAQEAAREAEEEMLARFEETRHRRQAQASIRELRRARRG